MPETDLDDSIFKCPLCGQAYIYNHNWDHDVYNQLDYAELVRISDDQVLKYIKDYQERLQKRKKEVTKFWNRFRKKNEMKIGKDLEKLSVDERVLLEYLKEKMIDGEYLEKIVMDLNLDKSKMLEIVDRLCKSELIIKRIYWPLNPGAHNFQVEMKDGDPYLYTNIKLNDL